MLLLINIHTHHPTPDALCIQNVRILSGNPAVPTTGFFSAGIHPWDTQAAEENWLDIFQSDSPRLVAIGESGLDYRPEYEPHSLQKEWFTQQILIANQLHKPLIIHNVHATDDTLKLVTEHSEGPVLLHGFTGSEEIVRQWLREKADTCFSFGPQLLHSPKTQKSLQTLFTEAPGHFFLETDDDTQVTIREMYIFAADLLQLTIEELKERIALNFNYLFPEITLD